MGAYLARAGHDITLVDTVDEHVTRSIESGFGSPGRSRSSPQRVPAFTPDALRGEWDTIMLATKAHHTEAATRALLPHLSADWLRDLGAERAQ